VRQHAARPSTIDFQLLPAWIRSADPVRSGPHLPGWGAVAVFLPPASNAMESRFRVNVNAAQQMPGKTLRSRMRMREDPAPALHPGGCAAAASPVRRIISIDHHRYRAAGVHSMRTCVRQAAVITFANSGPRSYRAAVPSRVEQYNFARIRSDELRPETPERKRSKASLRARSGSAQPAQSRLNHTFGRP